MIAGEADDQIAVLGLEINQEFNDATTVGTAIDIITKKNKLARLLTGIPLTSYYEVLQLGQTAVNVADGISPEHWCQFGRKLS